MSVSPLPSEIQQWTIDEVGAYLEKVCFMVFYNSICINSIIYNSIRDSAVDHRQSWCLFRKSMFYGFS